MIATRDDVEKAAAQAQLELSEEEIIELRRQIDDLLEHVQALDDIDTENVQPAFYLLPLQNVWRLDEDGRRPLAPEEVFRNAPEHERGFFKVPRIL
jgi:aspartyl-tRNA(Asn)/glutamyl-tRNA(Gln) amidotransferase subunit C